MTLKSLFPKDYSGQFLISFEPQDHPDATAIQLETVQVTAFDGLPAIAVHDASGRQIGLLLGHPVDYRAGTMPQGRLDLPAPMGDTPDGFVETHIYALGGSFLFVLDHGGTTRLYLDACGSMGAVYDPQTRQVGATSPLLVSPADADMRFEADLYEFLNIDRDGWFPAGMTAHRGVFRLMPNFYLDLADFSTHRHWPKTQIPQSDDPAATCGRIGRSVHDILAAITNSGPVHMALTAGNETRILTACSRDLLDAITFVTVDAGGIAELDRDRACELVARFGLDHKILPLAHADEAAADDWRARAGQAFGGPHPDTHPTIRPLASRPYFIGGLGGEIGRAFFWRPGDTPETEISAQTIAARMGMPIHPRVIQAIEPWLDTVAGFDAFQKLDLAYLEIRMGCWGFAPAYCGHRPMDLHPLISREAFAAMMALPPDWRRMADRTNPMITEIIRQNWPELLDMPISLYGDYRDRMNLIRRAIANPYLIVKKLRKKFG